MGQVQEPREPVSAERKVAPALVGEEWREFTRPPLYLLLLLGLLLITVAYQVRSGVSLSLDVGTKGDLPYLVRFNDREANKQLTFRWSRDYSSLVVPGPGRNQPLLLTLDLRGDRPSNVPPAFLTITVASNVVATYSVAPRPARYTATIPASLDTADDLTIALTSNAFTPTAENRKLGVVVDAITLSPSPSPNAGQGKIVLVRPPNRITLYLLTSLLFLYLTLRHLRVGWRAAWASCAALSFAAAALLAFNRYELTLFALPLLVTMLCVYLLSLLMPIFAEWGLTRLWAKPSAAALQALMLIYLAAFAVKAGGMMHPQFDIIDQAFRAHQVQELVADPAAFWDKYQRVSTADDSGGARGDQFSMLGQWQLQVPFPYPPLAYYALAPFGWLWPSSRDTMRLVTAADTSLAALASSVVFALYAIAKRGLGSGRAGLIAAAVASFAPISYLHFSDGNWPYIWGGWLATIYIMAAICLADRAAKPLPFITLSLLAALTLTSHTAIALFLGTFVVIAALLVLIFRRGDFGFAVWPLLASFAVGAGISLIYYGAYIGPLLTVALPSIFDKLSGGLGQEQRFLSVPLLTGFWPQVWAHFTTWPLLLASFGLILLTIRRPSDSLRRFARLIIGAWVIVFALFSLADLKVNLLQRHMLFALPLLGLLAGYTLTQITLATRPRLNLTSITGAKERATITPFGRILAEVLTREWAARLLTFALVVFLFIVGWLLWLNRVLHYVLPPGSG